MVLCGAGCAVMALGGVGAGVVGSVLLGLGYGTTNPASAHLLARFIGGRHRNLIFSVKQTGVPIGGMAAGLMAPSVTIAFGWEWALLTVTGVTVAVMALLQPLRREWDSDADPGLRLTESPLAGLMLVWRYPAVRWLSGSGFCFSLIQLCLLTFLVTLLVVEAEFSLVRAGILLAATNVAGFFGRLAWGWVADRMGRGLAVLVAIGILSLLAAAATSTLAPTWPLSAIQAVFLFYGFTAIGWNGVYLAELVRLSPAGHVGAVTGGAMAVTFAGIIAGPMAFSVAYGAIGSYSGTFVLLVAVAAAGAGLAALAGVASRRPPTR
jgi:MFS family permease